MEKVGEQMEEHGSVGWQNCRIKLVLKRFHRTQALYPSCFLPKQLAVVVVI